MEVSISQFRRELFTLVKKAMDGQTVWVSHKGKRFRIAPEIEPGGILSRITPLEVVNSASHGLEDTGLMTEMESAWEEDWSAL